MKLIGSLTSPYVRKIRVVLLEKQLPCEFVIDPPWEPGTRVADYNPLGKVPALVTDEEEVFFDSPVVAAYLETLGAAPALLPAAALESIRVRQLEALADGITDAGVAWLLETRRPPEKQDDGTIARQRAKVERGLDVLARRLAGKDWLYGDSLSLADVATGVCLLWLDFRLPQFDWRSSRPVLDAYARRLAQRPSFAQTVPVA